MAIEPFLASAGQVRRKAHTAAIELLLASAGFMPNGVELVENGLDLKASCPG